MYSTWQEMTSKLNVCNSSVPGRKYNKDKENVAGQVLLYLIKILKQRSMYLE
jgi:hypothetical protein